MQLSPSPYVVFPIVHPALFVLLPLVLAARLLIKPRPPTLAVAHGVLRFSLGFAKWALLVSPLWHLSGLILEGGEQSLSTGVAWIGLLAQMLSLHFGCTAAGDLVAGLGSMLGLHVADSIQEIFTFRRLTGGKYVLLLPLLLGLTLAAMLLRTLSLQDAWPHMKALFAAPMRSIPTVFQEVRVWSDYHVVTMLAALACLIGLPHSRDFLRVAAPWKAVICLTFFVLAVAIQWTRNAPM